MNDHEVKKQSPQLSVIRYIIVGDPIPLARPRFHNGRAWDSQKQLKLAWGIQLQQQHKNLPLFEAVPLHLDVEFFLDFPRVSAKKRAQYENKLHITKPDLSNLIKWVEDAATGILFSDDCIIASITCKKQYGDKPRTEFSVCSITPEELGTLTQEAAQNQLNHVMQCVDMYCRQMYCPRFYNPF